MKDYQKLYYSNQQDFLSYYKTSYKNSPKPGIIFLGGFKSDMNGTKAQAIASYASKNKYNFIKFDYSGHGRSSKNFCECSIDTWLEDTLLIIDYFAQDKPQILIGSSMGGWIMLLAALLRPEKICGLIGLAAAPDFTEDLIFNCLTEEQKKELLSNKIISYSNEFCQDSYPISLKLINDSRQHLILRNVINLKMPIRLIHGMQDVDVPYSTSIKIAELVESQDIILHLIKNAGHSLSEKDNLEIIYKNIDEMINLCHASIV
jgi:pimeloyl-ACP methyl ester carboxylesterase